MEGLGSCDDLWYQSAPMDIATIDLEYVPWSRGATDNASDYGSEDCRFESCRDRPFTRPIQKSAEVTKNCAPPGGLEPPTFRLTAERANQLRHGGFVVSMALGNLLLQHAACQQGES